MTSKYTGIVGVAPILATVIWLVASGRVRPLSGLGILLAAGLASIVAAFLTGPYLFLSFRDVLADVAKEARPTHLGATSKGFLWSLWYYLATAAPAALGWGACILAAVGALLSLRRPLGAVTLAFVVVYLLFISSLNLVWYRWFLPIVPFSALFVAVSVEKIDQWASSRRSRLRFAALMIPVVLLAPTLFSGLGVARTRALDRDTRVAALEWVERTLPKGSRVLMETGAPGISSLEYQAFVVKDGGWSLGQSLSSGLA